MNDVERKALEVAKTPERDEYVNTYGQGFWFRSPESMVRALSRAGLLRTGLELRAVEACRDAALDRKHFMAYTDVMQRVYMIGREALALEKPKERYMVHQRNMGETAFVKYGWCVTDERNPPHYHLCVSEEIANAVAAALNAEEAAR